jgi:hypothetical protein
MFSSSLSSTILFYELTQKEQIKMALSEENILKMSPKEATEIIDLMKLWEMWD